MRSRARSPSEQSRVTASLGAPLALWPAIPELFHGIRSLGARPRLVSRLLKQAGLRRRSSVVDLGCGKGSVCLELASELGCRVVGVDLCPPFLAEAAAAANRLGLRKRVQFELADLRRWRPSRPGDAAVLLNGPPLSRAASIARGVVKSGGLYVIDDLILVGKASGRRKSHPRVPTLHAARSIIERTGDTVIAIHVPPSSAVANHSRRLNDRIESNARGAKRLHPELEADIDAYLEHLRWAEQTISGPLRPVLWVVRRA